MNWLTNWMTREGPGIPKNAPKKRGLALFFFILAREAWDLFRLNILMLVFSIPLITAPAAFVAGLRVTTLMVEDKNVYLWPEFFGSFKRTFLRATLWAMAFGFIGVISVYAIYIYAQMAKYALIYALPVGVAVLVLLAASMVAVCLFQLMVRCDLNATAMLKASVLAMLAQPLPVLGGIAFMLALWLLHVIFYPVSVFMPVIFNFSLGALAIAFGTFKATSFALGYVETTDVDPGEEEHETAHMRT